MLHTGNTDQRRALLYVAARFMMVSIDLCEAQARKGSGRKQQAFKLGPGFKPQASKLTSTQATSRKLPDRGAWIKFRVSRIVGLYKVINQQELHNDTSLLTL
jgi:hypothetical protein